MKKIIILATAMVAFAANAECYGTGSYRSCTDDSGNNYTINKSRNSTYVQGSNAETGSTWNSQTYRSGNTSSTYGTDSDGNSWNAQTYRTPRGSTTYGTDSNGNSFTRICDRTGCY